MFKAATNMNIMCRIKDSDYLCNQAKLFLENAKGK